MEVSRSVVTRIKLSCALVVALLCVGAGAQQGAVSHTEATHQAAPFGVVAYPDRPVQPKEVLDRGKAAYSVNCSFCHGADAAGGSVGPNLLRSEVVLRDVHGELILPIVHGARLAQGMPKIDLPDLTVADIAAWLHSLKTGGNMTPTEEINIVTGNAAAGNVAFTRRCAGCHSMDGDLKGFAAKFAQSMQMQQTWISPGVIRGPGMPELHVPPVTATVVVKGKKITGRLGAYDDFSVVITTADGVVHTVALDNGVPRVVVHDPLKPHREMLPTLTDAEIHNITAYLESLR
jgi:mono/diheme cytochrome c family protein